MEKELKTFKIADKTFKNIYVQGPMAGFTDVAMRTLAFENGASLCYTEMISTNALAFNSKATINMVEDTQNDIGPIALQLFGYELDNIEKAIGIVEKIGKYDFLDFNLGCPVLKVMKQKAGSHLLKDLDYLYELTRLLVTKSRKPVIVKTRLGYKEPEDILDIAKVLENAGVKAIAIHGRTKDELYTGKPHYDLIKRVKDDSNIPIIVNGNLNVDNAYDVTQETGCDACMIARNAIGNPLIFKNLINKELGLEVRQPTFEEQLNMLERHVELIFAKNESERKVALTLRSIAPSYFSKFSFAKDFRMKLVHCLTKKDYLQCIQEAKNEYEIHND